MHYSVLIAAFAIASVKGHVAHWNTPNQLHPVQGLYVKPSDDGTTGDLYVAATEDSGVKTQWLTDQPINFLPQHASLAYSSLASALPHDEAIVTNQKRAVVTSPAFKYTYSLPGASDNNAIPYTYAMPSPAKSNEGSSECADPGTATYPYSAFQYYYPQMMSAFVNAMNVLKQAGVSDETAGAVTAQAAAAPAWPQGYTYPVQYVMVNPAAWAQSQATSAPATVAAAAPAAVPSSPTPASDETDV